MAKTSVITGIDVGTSAVRVVVAEYSPEKELPVIVSTGYRESKGLRHGYVINFDEAIEAVAEAVADALRGAKNRKVSRILASIGGVSLGSSTSDGSVAVSRADTEVSDIDVERSISSAQANLKDIANRKILHTIPQYFKLDGRKVWGRPHGMKGNILESRALFITCLEQHFSDLSNMFESADISPEAIYASPIADGHAALTKLQKKAGCVLANIGAETVSLVVYEEGLPVSLAVFPIGSTDITNDIALGLRIPLEDAEKIKKGRDDTSNSQLRKKIDEIIEARLSDIFELIESHLKKIGKNGLLPAGIILSGGGAQIPGTEELAKEALRLPARVALPVTGLKDSSWLVAYGLTLLGGRGEEEESFGMRFAKSTTNGVLSWVKQLLP